MHDDDTKPRNPGALPPVTRPDQSGETLIPRPDWWVPVALVLVLLVLLPIGAYGCHKLTKKKTREKSDAFARTAESLIASGKLEDALPPALASIRLAPWNPAGQLQMARGLSGLSHPHAVYHWNDYFAMQPAPDALSSVEYARYCLQMGRPKAARDHLVAKGDTNEFVIGLALASLETNVAACEARLSEAYRKARTPDEKLAVAAVAFGTPSARAQVSGRTEIMGLAATGVRRAQEFLLSQPGTNAAFAVASFERLGTNRWLPDLQPRADLVAGRSRDASALLERLQGHPDDLPLAYSLANLGTNLATPALLGASRDSAGLFFLQADQLRDQRRWADLEAVAIDPKRRLPEDLKATLAALSYWGRGDTNQAYKWMTLALQESRSSPARLLGMARLAARDQYAEFEAGAWMQIGSEPELDEVGGRRLFGLGMLHQRLDWVEFAARQLSRGEPTNSWFGTWVYTACVRSQSASDLPEPRGTEPDCVVGAILRQVFRGEVDAALARAEETMGWADQPLRLRLVRALAYQRAGRRSDMRRELAEAGELKGLLPEEIRLFGNLDPKPSQ